MICDVCKGCIKGAWGGTRLKRVASVKDFLKNISLLNEHNLAGIERAEIDHDGPPSVYRHHKDQASYEKSYDQGCILCKAWSYPTRLYRRPEFMKLECFSVSYIEFRDDGTQKVPLMHVENEHNHQTFTLVPIEERDHALGIHNTLGPSTDCPASWQMMNNWMSICTESHPDCQEQVIQPNFRPKRLLKIESEDTFRIINASNAIYTPEYYEYDPATNRASLEPEWDPSMPYAVLSYRWDDLPWDRAFRATSSNLATFTVSRPVADLPKTYRDAVRVAQHFGYRYIWIDRLCTLWGGCMDLPDGGQEDYECNTNTVRDICQNAGLGIVLLGSAGQNSGLFLEREIEKRVPTTLSMKRTRDGSIEMLRAEQEYGEESIKDFLAEPVHVMPHIERERLLPPRTLYFGSKEIYWECRTTACCERVPHGLYGAFMGPDIRSKVYPDDESYVVVDENGDEVCELNDTQMDGTKDLSCGSDRAIDFRLLRKKMIHKPLLYFGTKEEEQEYFDWKALLEVYAMKRWLFYCCSRIPRKMAMRAMAGKDVNLFLGTFDSDKK